MAEFTIHGQKDLIVSTYIGMLESSGRVHVGITFTNGGQRDTVTLFLDPQSVIDLVDSVIDAQATYRKRASRGEV